LQLLERIEPIDALVVHAMTGLAQLQVDHSSVVAAMPLNQAHDLFAQLAIAVHHWLVAQRARR